MSRFRIPFLSLFLSLFLVLFSALPVLAARNPAPEQLVLSLAPAWPVAEGRAVLTTAYHRLGIPVVFRDYPARRGLAEANDGSADGLVVRMGGLTEELPNLIQVEPPIASVQGVAVTCDPKLRITDWRDLTHLRVGVHPGILLSEKLVRGVDRVIEGQWDRLFRLLYLGRLDVIIAYDGIERTQTGRPDAARLRVIRPKAWRRPLYHYLNREHAALIPRLETVLRDMRGSGEMARIRHEVEAGTFRPRD